ncbi:MAG: CinA family nicotinamide mononucleotide deamidase-related protein, partial [Myxococcota bacterium]
RRSTTVGDNSEQLKQVFQEVQQRAEIVIVTGGLGPTEDDRTVQVLADVHQRKCIEDPQVVQDIRSYFQRLQRPMLDVNRKQALIPRGATPLPNPEGTAPGIFLSTQDCDFFCLPGVPSEMRLMLREQVLPRLLHTLQRRHPNFTMPKTTLFKCLGVGESRLAELFAPLYPLPSGINIGTCARSPEVHVSLHVKGQSTTDVETQFVHYETQLHTLLQPYLIARDQSTFPQEVAALFRQQQKTLALAESCTGGAIAQTLTQEAGASAYFLLSAVTYSNAAKQMILGVPAEMLEQYGAVSQPVAVAMAQGALRVSHADIALAVTGIAGPAGGSLEKPVGTVHIALATAQQTWHRAFL